MIKLSLPVKRLTTNEISLDLLFLLAFPFVLLLVNDSWSFLTPSLWVDPYIYEGFFWDLKKNLLLHKAALEFPYYSSRLPWLLMGNAAHSIASPDTANLILRLSLLYVSVLSLYAVVRMAWRNGLAALIAALVLGANTAFLWSIGWDYVDGPGITLILLTLALLTRAATSDSWPVALWLSGVVAATTVSVNIFLVVVMPSLLVWYLLVNARRSKHRVDQSVACMIIGGLSGIGVFGLVNMHLTGDFNYLQAQIDAARTIDASAYDTNAFSTAGWLVVPGLAAFLSAVALSLVTYLRLSKRSLSEAEFLGATSAVCFLLVLGIYLYMQLLTTSEVLMFSYYANFLLPFAFVVVGASISLAFTGFAPTPPLRLLAALLAVIGVLAPFIFAELRFARGCPTVCLSSERIQLLFVAGTGLVALAALTRSASFALAGLLVLSLVNVNVGDRRIFSFSEAQSEAGHRRFLMVFDAASIVRSHNPEGELRHWLSASDPYGWVYAGVAGQNLWNARLVGLEFPRIRPSASLQAGQSLALYSASKDDAISSANESLMARELHLEVFDQVRVTRGPDSFTIFFTCVTPGSRN